MPTWFVDAEVRRSSGDATVALPLMVNPLAVVKVGNFWVLLIGAMTQEKVWDADEAEVAAVIVMLNVPVAVGVPLMTPLLLLMLKPVGRPVAL